METVPEGVKTSARRITTDVTIDQVRATTTLLSDLTWINEIAVR
jgi:hypothetical protein